MDAQIQNKSLINKIGFLVELITFLLIRFECIYRISNNCCELCCEKVSHICECYILILKGYFLSVLDLFAKLLTECAKTVFVFTDLNSTEEFRARLPATTAQWDYDWLVIVRLPAEPAGGLWQWIAHFVTYDITIWRGLKSVDIANREMRSHDSPVVGKALHSVGRHFAHRRWLIEWANIHVQQPATLCACGSMLDAGRRSMNTHRTRNMGLERRGPFRTHRSARTESTSIRCALRSVWHDNRFNIRSRVRRWCARRARVAMAAMVAMVVGGGRRMSHVIRHAAWRISSQSSTASENSNPRSTACVNARSPRHSACIDPGYVTHVTCIQLALQLFEWRVVHVLVQSMNALSDSDSNRRALEGMWMYMRVGSEKSRSNHRAIANDMPAP